MAKRTTSSSTGVPPSTRKRTTNKNTNVDAAEAQNTAGPSAPGMEPTEDDIRLRAYHRYLERGASHGADFDDWVQAEKDLKTPRHN